MCSARTFATLSTLTLCSICLLISTGCSRSPAANFERGEKALAEGKNAEAEIDYLKATQAKNDFGEAWYGLGLAQFRQNHLSEAMRSLTRAGELLPSRQDVSVSVAEVSMATYLVRPSRANAGLYQRAAATASDLLKKNPNSYDGLRLQGFVAMIDKHYPEAADLLSRANAMKPGQGDLTQALMECLIQSGRGEEAEKLGKAFLEHTKNFFPVYDALYAYYVSTHRDADAEQLLKNKIAANPGVLPFRLQLARYYLDAHKEAEMSAVITQVIDDPKDFPDARLDIGDFYSGNNRPDDALRVFQAGAQQNGKQKTKYQLRSANLLVSMGKSQEALALLDSILKADSENFEARATRASIRLRNGSPADLQAAFTELSDLSKVRPKDAVIHYNLGRAWLAKGDTDSALNEFREALRQDPQLLSARVLAADVSMREGDYAQANRYSADVVAQTGGVAGARLLQAQALTGMGNFDQATREVNQLNQEFPNAIEPKLQLAALRLAQGRSDESEQMYRQLYESNRADTRSLAGLVNAMVAQRHYDAAIQFLNQERQRSGAPVAQIDAMLADTALRGRKLDIAIQQYSRITSTSPASAFDHLRLGDAYLQKGNSQQAVSEFQTARNLNPKDAQTQAMLALAQERAGNDSDAERSYREAIALAPENPVLKNNLAFLLAEKNGNLDDALRLAREASNQQPGNTSLSDTLAYIYIKKNLPDSAIQILSNATRKSPDHPVYHYHLAMALLQKGDKSGARRECEAALADSPTKDDEGRIRAMLAGIQ